MDRPHAPASGDITRKMKRIPFLSPPLDGRKAEVRGSEFGCAFHFKKGRQGKAGRPFLCAQFEHHQENENSAGHNSSPTFGREGFYQL